MTCMSAPVHFYIDDSGTRVPDRQPTPFDPKCPNHFALGGILVREEDEDAVAKKSAREDEQRIKQYYKDLITGGLPFNPETSNAYTPLSAHEFNETLIELRFKAKTSPPMQVADLYLWPIAMHRYGRGGQPYERFRESGRLIETQLSADQILSRGTKYSCFGLVDEAKR
jgi:Protein of unknown function (DUF3800)